MPVPTWIKRRHSLYLPARAAVLSLFGPDRFYTPFSAASLCAPDDDGQIDEILRDIRLIRRENGLSIWFTPAGEIATMESEMPEHLAFLLAEFRDHPYFVGSTDIAPGMIVLDVGANIGLFAKQALGAGAARVVCLEPSAGTANALRLNLESAVSSGRVSILEKGAWDCAASVQMTVDPKRPARSSCVDRPPEETAYQLTVAVDRIDRVVGDLLLPRVDFIKMDIEGAECKALEGAVETLRRHRPRLAVAVEHTDQPLRNARDVRNLVMSLHLGYRCRAGRYSINSERRLAPEILYFSAESPAFESGIRRSAR
jgi:FkbM family methyltransferase